MEFVLDEYHCNCCNLTFYLSSNSYGFPDRCCHCGSTDEVVGKRQGIRLQAKETKEDRRRKKLIEGK